MHERPPYTITEKTADYLAKIVEKIAYTAFEVLQQGVCNETIHRTCRTCGAGL